MYADGTDSRARVLLRENGIINITGDITRQSVEILKEDIDWFSNFDATRFKRVQIFIHSPGGNVTCGIEMYEMLLCLRDCAGRKIPTTGIVKEEASSMASVILQACSYKAMHKDALSVLHRLKISEGLPWGVATAMRIKKKYQQERVDKIYMFHLSCSKEELHQIYDKGSPLTAYEALRIGLVNNVFNNPWNPPP